MLILESFALPGGSESDFRKLNPIVHECCNDVK